MSSSSMASRVSFVKPQADKSRLLMLLAHFSGGGVIGLDRWYMGCKASAVIKFILFVVVVVGSRFQDSNTDVLGYPLSYFVMQLLSVLIIWTLLDGLAILFTVLSMSSMEPWTFRSEVRIPGYRENRATALIAFLIAVALVFGLYLPFLPLLVLVNSPSVVDLPTVPA